VDDTGFRRRGQWTVSSVQMSLIIQVTTTEGRVLEPLRHEVDTRAELRENQVFQISFQTDDKALALFAAKMRSTDCLVEKLEKGKGGHSVVLTLSVRQIRHLMDARTGEVESLVVISPTSRQVDVVLSYLVDPEGCDPRIRTAVRGSKQ